MTSEVCILCLVSQLKFPHFSLLPSERTFYIKCVYGVKSNSNINHNSRTNT